MSYADLMSFMHDHPFQTIINGMAGLIFFRTIWREVGERGRVRREGKD